jgi:hypothetical protein
VAHTACASTARPPLMMCIVVAAAAYVTNLFYFAMFAVFSYYIVRIIAGIFLILQ